MSFRSSRIRLAAACTFLTLFLMSFPARASDDPPNGPAGHEDPDATDITAVVSGVAVRVDGYVDPQEWAGAPMIHDFTDRNPVEGDAPSQRTEVRVLYTTTHLYVAFSCFDDDPGGIVSRIDVRDSWTLQTDKVQVDIDPYHDHRTAYHFAVGVANVQVDSHGMDVNWNGVWESATRVTDEGWFAEIAIPFSILRFEPKPSHIFGINFGRDIQRTKEDISWRGWRRDDYGRVDRYGHLQGLAGLRSGHDLELLPYAKASSRQFYNAPPSGTSQTSYTRNALGDFGVDLRYGVTSNLSLDVSLNPDFGQIAPDEEQISVTRYERFFRELRPFFQEGQSIFHVPMQIFYTRRIGKQIFNGPEVNMLAGAKLTGRTGPWQIGVINAVTEEKRYALSSSTTGFVPMATYSVVRLERDILSRSSIGFLGVSKDSRSGEGLSSQQPYQRSVGVDVSLNSASNHYLSAMLARSLNSRAGGDDWAGQLRMGLRSDLWEYMLGFNYLGPRFDVSEVGYITQVDRRRPEWNVGWKPRPEKYGIRRIELKTSGLSSMNFDGIYAAGRYGGELKVQTMGYWEFDGKINVEDTRYYDVYAASPYSGTVLSRFYRGWGYSFSLNTDRSQDFSFDLNTSWGDFLDYGDLYWGRDWSSRIGFSIRRGSQFTGSLRIQHIREYFGSGTLDETKNLLITNAEYSFTPNLQVKFYNQLRLFDDGGPAAEASRANTLNLVLSYFLNAKSVLYLVYNEVRDDTIADRVYFERYGRLPVSDRVFLTKLTYWFSL